jgi:branched-chain amino acid transport system ATP-binding protein
MTSSNGAGPVLELRGVSAGYGDTTVLRDVDLAIAPGTIATLLGPNGAGKTTLLRAASGLVKPGRGSIRIKGRDATTLAPHARARLGLCLIPEGRGVFPNLSVRENLLLQIPTWAPPTSIDLALDAFPALAGRLGTRVGSLSGGQQQMVALARCFLAGPDVVLLDEVSMGLAPRVVDEIFSSLRALAATGITLLLVEQYVTRALEMADTAHLINRGSLTFSGPAAALDEDAVMRGYLGADIHIQSEEEECA